MNILEFEVHGQVLTRIDSQDVVSKNKNIYKCRFTFEENSEWDDANKFVIFTDGWGNSSTQHLGKSSNILSCLIPDKVLQGSYFKISIYAKDLITTNTISIALIQSGYTHKHHPPHHNHHCGYTGKDIFVEIFDRLDATIDSIVYDDHTLHLFARDNIIESIYLPLLDENEIEEMVTNLTNEFILNLPIASDETNGLMSKENYVKLDSIETGANKTIVDKELNPNSTNPVENQVIYESLNEHKTQVANQLNDFEVQLDNQMDDFNVMLDGKEDTYDYVERLDNLIVDLINRGN